MFVTTKYVSKMLDVKMYFKSKLIDWFDVDTFTELTKAERHDTHAE